MSFVSIINKILSLLLEFLALF